jgi:hypothetical protein
MSKQYFKATITYDTNLGFDETEILYVIENNSTDYRVVVNENGEYPKPYGTDWYCDALSVVLNIGGEVDNLSYKVKKQEIGWKDLPDKLRNILA